MSKISEQIREAALGPTPTALFPSGVMIADWVGEDRQYEVLRFKQNEYPLFSTASDTAQRTFLLLVAEALE
jgi:hypothetical protein